MNLNLYGVLDQKANYFKSFQFRDTHGVAIRDFADAVRDSKTYLSLHPEDYAIYYLGSIDNETGVFDAVHPIQLISRATEHVLLDSKPVQTEVRL